ncbi:MAG: hypothetical protein J6K04_05725 [Lachnospiraceae bacterium]|nr:hypothetical protein [Lachnospiraceae bacterium]
MDIVQIFNITNFYLPYILSVPVLLAVVLKLLCIQGESQKELNGFYYALILASVEYLILVLIDLVLLKNATLELLNAEESYAVTKMILNGAFKDTRISSNSDDVKIEFDLSAMINSLLKDCVYELGCSVGNKKYMLMIPMTFGNDFENSYNIYDLQVGSVTIVGNDSAWKENVNSENGDSSFH